MPVTFCVKGQQSVEHTPELRESVNVWVEQGRFRANVHDNLPFCFLGQSDMARLTAAEVKVSHIGHCHDDRDETLHSLERTVKLGVNLRGHEPAEIEFYLDDGLLKANKVINKAAYQQLQSTKSDVNTNSPAAA